MVILNFTILIQLALFLLFLWGTSVWVIRPTLRVMDERAYHVDQQENRARVDLELAQTHEKRYAQARRDMRLKAEQGFRDARRAALDAQAQTLAQQRKQADRAIAIVREEAGKLAQKERGSYKQLAPALSRLIAARIGIEGPQA